VTGDYDTAPDIGVLCRGVEDGMSELLKLAGGDEVEASQASEEAVAANQNRREWVFTSESDGS
jgi:hypothetical protein